MLTVVLRIPRFVFAYPRMELSNSIARLGLPIGGEMSQAAWLGLSATFLAFQAALLGLLADIDGAQDNWLGSPA